MDKLNINKMISSLDFIEEALVTSNFKEYPHRLKKLVTFVNEQKYILDILGDDGNFQTWLQRCRQSVGSMVGSGRLLWPDDDLLEMVYKWNIIKESAEIDDVLWISHDFYYAGRSLNDNTISFHQNITQPFINKLRAIIDYFENMQQQKNPEAFYPRGLSPEIYDKLHSAVFNGPVYIGNNDVKNINPSIQTEGNASIAISGDNATSNQNIQINKNNFITSEKIISDVNEINSIINKNKNSMSPEILGDYRKFIRPTLDEISDTNFDGQTDEKAKENMLVLLNNKSPEEKNGFISAIKKLPQDIFGGVAGNFVYDMLKLLIFGLVLLV